MNRSMVLGFISLFLLVFLAGFCIADDAPSYIAYIQGGESSIANGSDSAYVITMKDIIPYLHMSDGKESSLIPVTSLPYLKYPMDAALVFFNADNETTVMVQVVNVSLSDNNKVLTIQADPLESYDGEWLKSFNDKREDINVLLDGQSTSLGIYLDGVSPAITNQWPCNDGECPVGCGMYCFMCVPC